jgi:hypothetical protein
VAGNLPVPNGLECKLVWTLSGVPTALNIWHFRTPTPLTLTQAQATAIDTQIKSQLSTSGLLASLWTSVALARVESRTMTAPSDPWFVGGNAPVPGTGAGNPLPAATGFVVSLSTGLRGRSFSGRHYQWGYTEDANDAAGGITSAASAATVTFVSGAQIVGVPNAVPGAIPVILSRFTTAPGTSTPIERNPPIMTQIVNHIARDLRWDVQRRRAIPGV